MRWLRFRSPQGLIPLIVLSVLNHSCFTGTRVLVSLFALKLGASTFVVGTIVALYSLLPVILGVQVGKLIDRFDSRWPLLLGSSVVLLGALVPAVFPALSMLYFTPVLVGVGTIVLQVSNQQLISEMDEKGRAGNFALFGLGVAGAGFLGPLTVGLSVDHLGFRGAFIVAACFPSLSLLLQLSRLMSIPEKKPFAKPAALHARGSSFELLRMPALRKLFVVNFLLYMATDLHSFMVPIYGAAIGLSASAIGLILSCFACGMFLIRCLIKVISRHVREWHILIGVMLLDAAIYLVYPMVREPVVLMSFSFLLGMGLGCSQPMGLSLLHDIVPRHRQGEAIGLRLSLTNAGQAAMPVIFGFTGALGAIPVFWAVAICLVGGGWLGISADRNSR